MPHDEGYAKVPPALRDLGDMMVVTFAVGRDADGPLCAELIAAGSMQVAAGHMWRRDNHELAVFEDDHDVGTLIA